MSEIDKFWLSINSQCNNNCIFCLDSDNQKNGFFNDLAVIKQQIQEIDKKNTKRLIISGGEASIHPNFLDIINYAKVSGFREIQTITNGRMFSYYGFAKQALKAGLSEVTFSLHGHKAELHDNFTGVQGSFEQALQGLINIRKFPQVIVNIDIVINRLNFQHIYEMIRFFSEKHGVFEYDLLQVVPFGRAWQNKKKLFYDFKQALPFLQKVFELAKNDKRFHIWTNRFPAKYLQGYEFLIQPPDKLFDDVLGRQEIFNKYLYEDLIMPCRNKERCEFCNLNDFCNKLMIIKEALANDEKKFNLRIEELTKMPVCLDLINKPIDLNFINNDKAIDLFKFIRFYINYLYNLKSDSCSQCKFVDTCAGLNINIIREKGFKILKPIK